MRMIMQSILTRSVTAAALVGTLALTAVPASAMSASAMSASALSDGVATPLPLATGAQPEVTLVPGGCGPFAHRGFYGACRPNFYGGGYRPLGFYRPYGYRWGGGWHRGWHHW